MNRPCEFSPDRLHRYTLWREWIGGAGGYVQFIGLNPSTADDAKDDPTIRRCIGFAKSWGFSGLCMTNLFAFRATQPADMKTAADPIGPENDRLILECAADAGIVIAAWGAHGTYLQRDVAVRKLVPKLHYLRLTAAGQPGHPLYLPALLCPEPWSANA